MPEPALPDRRDRPGTVATGAGGAATGRGA